MLSPVPAEALGITFRTLEKADLDMIEQSLGRRVGVEIVDVKAGSAGAAAGVKVGDVIFNFGKVGVDSAQTAVAALKAATGTVQIAAMTKKGEEYEPVQYALTIPASEVGQQPAGQASQAGDQAPAATDDPMLAYFDLMDFVRSQAWGRKVVTPPQERQRVAALVQMGFNEMPQADQAQLLAMPQALKTVQATWQKGDEAEKNKQRALWREQLLMPGNLLPPPANVQAFQYPAEWTGGLQEIQGIAFLFIGPNGGTAQWEKVLDTPNSPDGALFALFDLTPEMQQLPDWLSGARYLAQQLIPTGLQGFKEINALPIADQGAVITIVGKLPGQAQERFYWIGVAAFGQGKAFAGRLGGSVDQADDLLPAFRHMLASLQLNPPQAAAGGGGGGAWEAAWSRLDVAITKNIWAPSGN